MGASGFHRPALGALTQKLARPDEFAAVAALSSIRGTVGMVAGPALSGLLLARWGAVGAYLFDFATFIAALFFLARIPRERIGGVIDEKFDEQGGPAERPHLLADLAEGVRFARARPELMGTYIVDIVAMAFAFPIALFPAMAAADGRTESVGWLLSAMSLGALVIGIFSGWTGKVRRHCALRPAWWSRSRAWPWPARPTWSVACSAARSGTRPSRTRCAGDGRHRDEQLPGRAPHRQRPRRVHGRCLGRVGLHLDRRAGVPGRRHRDGFALPRFWAYRSTLGNGPR